MTDNDKDNDDARDDVDWLRDAFNRAIQGDNGTVPDATRPAVNPFAGLTPDGDTSSVEPVEPVLPVVPATPVVPPTVTPPAPPAESGHRHDLDLDFETENLPPVTAFEPVVPQERPLPSVVTDYPPTEALDAVDLPTTLVPEPVAPVSAPSAPPAATAETSGIDRLDALFQSSDDSAETIPLVAPRTVEPKKSTRSRTTDRPVESTDPAKFRQGLMIAIGVILVVILAIGAWVAGVVVATPKANPVPTPSAEPTIPSATQPPGEYPFDALFGGECVDPFTDAWAATFTVVDCSAPHAAQLVYAGDLAADGSYLSYPGDARVGKAALSACSRKGVLDLTAAKTYNDVQMSTAYPANSEAWDTGDTRYYCFASLASAGPIEGSLAGKLLTDSGEPTPEATPSE